MSHQDIDRRAGYQRQEDEPVAITCECGARVVERSGELHHVGECTVKTLDHKVVTAGYGGKTW